jgi:hypothetical protein
MDYINNNGEKIGSLNFAIGKDKTVPSTSRSSVMLPPTCPPSPLFWEARDNI